MKRISIFLRNQTQRKELHFPACLMNTKSKLLNLNSQIWSRGWCAQVDDRPEEEQGLDGEDQGVGGQAPGGGDGSQPRH